MSQMIVLVADVLVGALLIATIFTSVTLSKRITQLKIDEAAMRQTITELVIVTETAERAIGGLRTTLSECDRNLAERLRSAEHYSSDLAAHVEAGEAVVNRLSQIVEATKHLSNVPSVVKAKEKTQSDRVNAAASAAHALAERALRRLEAHEMEAKAA